MKLILVALYLFNAVGLIVLTLFHEEKEPTYTIKEPRRDSYFYKHRRQRTSYRRQLATRLSFGLLLLLSFALSLLSF